MSHFFAQMARMKLIRRWPLMRNVSSENISEHSLQVAMVTYALVVIRNRKFLPEGETPLDPAHLASLAMFHDATEILTGDLPTPVKYFNPDISREYKKIEQFAEQKLIEMLPEELQEDFAPLLDSSKSSELEHKLVKDADTLCAYLKCLEELRSGNQEFQIAKERLEQTLQERMTPELDYFMQVFVPSFDMTLDDISG